jgi:hypothetical protein
MIEGVASLLFWVNVVPKGQRVAQPIGVSVSAQARSFRARGSKH